jgi:hypothetical protein
MTSSFNTSAISVFCKELREARTYQQISLPEIERITRISDEYIEALEAGRWEEVPRAYLRGYLALYATAVGMNREKVLRSFDRLVSAGDAPTSVEFDEAPSALRKPQAIGVTRAKIRVSWFVSLSQNRRVLYLLTAVVFIAYLTLLRISRKPIETSTPLQSFKIISMQYQKRSFSPFTQLQSENSSESYSRSKGIGHIYLIGLKKGQATIHCDNDPAAILSYSEYDTIAINYSTEVSLTSTPRGALRALKDTVAVDPDKLIQPNAEFYIFSRINPIANVRKPLS